MHFPAANIARPNLSIPEQWHEAAMACVDAEAAAQLLEETKSAKLSEMIGELQRDTPGLAFNKAEMTAKASPEWRAWVEGMVRARKAANRARVNRDFLRMQFSVWIAEDANHRAGSRT